MYSILIVQKMKEKRKKGGGEFTKIQILLQRCGK
jgi:hypothetical protein